MPTYEYACTSCGHRLEAVQSFSEEPLTTCPECGGALRKVFGSVGIVLKGSGFYKTDSRPSGAASGTKKPSGSEGDGAAASNGSSSDSPSTKDAPSSNGSKEGSPKAPAPSATPASTTGASTAT